MVTMLSSIDRSEMKDGSKRSRRSSSPGGTRMRLGKRSRSWSPEEDEATAGWAPVPGKIHPAIGLDEVEAAEYGFIPVRTVDTPRDEDGYRSDVFFCDKAAYRIFNDALARKTDLGAWVRRGLRLGILLVHHNYDNVLGWRMITSFGRHQAAVPTRGKKAIPAWLMLHGEQDDECVESAKLLAEAAGGSMDVHASFFNSVFVCGNTKLAELLRKDFAGAQRVLVKSRAVNKPRDVPFRLWHVTSKSSGQAEEECLDDTFKDSSYCGTDWWRWRDPTKPERRGVGEGHGTGAKSSAQVYHKAIYSDMAELKTDAFDGEGGRSK